MPPRRSTPFASAQRAAARRAAARPPSTRTSDSAKSEQPRDVYGRDKLSVRLVLQVWESVDGLRRVILEPAGNRQVGTKPNHGRGGPRRMQHWRLVRVVRETGETPWAEATVHTATTHQHIARAHGRLRLWLVYGR